MPESWLQGYPPPARGPPRGAGSPRGPWSSGVGRSASGWRAVRNAATSWGSSSGRGPVLVAAGTALGLLAAASSRVLESFCTASPRTTG